MHRPPSVEFALGDARCLRRLVVVAWMTVLVADLGWSITGGARGGSWLAGLFAHAQMDAADRAGVLLGQPIGKGGDAGPTVCSCFGVGRNTICAAIQDQKLTTTAQVTDAVIAALQGANI